MSRAASRRKLWRSARGELRSLQRRENNNTRLLARSSTENENRQRSSTEVDGRQSLLCEFQTILERGDETA